VLVWKFTKIRPAGVDLFHADERTYRTHIYIHIHKYCIHTHTYIHISIQTWKQTDRRDKAYSFFAIDLQTRRKKKGCDITHILNCLPPSCRMVLSLVNCIYVSKPLFSHSGHRPTQVMHCKISTPNYLYLLNSGSMEETMRHYTRSKLCTAVLLHHCNVLYVLTRRIMHSVTYCGLDRKQRWHRIALCIFYLT
jgi:hypothetical protein